MRKIAWSFALLWLCAALGARAQDAAQAPAVDAPRARGGLPPTAHRYELSATLDPKEKRVQGSARITFTNTSSRPLSALWFHLYLNAFRDDESVFARESGGSMRGNVQQGYGSIELLGLSIDGHDVLGVAQPELSPRDFTQLKVPLALPLPPAGRLVIEVRFISQLPPVFARTGWASDFFAVGQWFPKLAKLEPDGSFASFPFHALGEFYSDFADYSLELDTPTEWAVVATGTLEEEQRAGTRVRRRFRADAVHDFAFFAGRDFRLDVESVDGILVRYLSPPGYDAALAQDAALVRAGLRHFGRLFGPYPYPAFSVVIPPRDAAGAAGMEYPTLIAAGGPWAPIPGLPSLGGATYVAHELAHQWFYGLLANDELHHPVLDEAFAEWATLDLLRAHYGAREGVLGLRLDRFEVERGASAKAISPGHPAYHYEPSEYGAAVYFRGAGVLETVRRSLGSARFERALALYTERHRFAHPTPSDLARTFDDVYGAGFSARVLQPLLFEGETSTLRVVAARTRRGAQGWTTRVRARRDGVPLPSWLAAFAADGRELARERFPADQPDLTTELRTTEPVARVVLDPDRAVLVDPEVSDQVVQLRPRSHEPPWVSQLLSLSELLLAWVGP